MKKPSRYSFYVKALEFYKEAKKQFALNERGTHKSRKYDGLCNFLDSYAKTHNFTGRQFDDLQQNIWTGVNKFSFVIGYFPTHRDRVNHIDAMIQRFSAKVDKYK
jgi:hypothetical protein